MAQTPRFTSFAAAGRALDPLDQRRDRERAEPAAARGGAATAPEPELVVEAEVFEVLEGFGLAHLRGLDGRVYGINRQTRGVLSFESLHEGQRYRCEVARKFDRVVRADLID